jgi:hypothetical protein
MSMSEQRPAYSTSKRAMWLCGGLAWGVVYMIVIGGLRGSAESVALANIVVPSMVMMIVALLGVHRAFGSMDMRTMIGGHRDPRNRRPRKDVEYENAEERP